MEMGEEYKGLKMYHCRIRDIGILFPKDLFNLKKQYSSQYNFGQRPSV